MMRLSRRIPSSAASSLFARNASSRPSPSPGLYCRCSSAAVGIAPPGTSSKHETLAAAASSARRSHSTTDATASAVSNTHHPNRSKLGIGGSKLANVKPEQYASVIATSLHSGVTTFESGHGGQQSLANAFGTALAHFEEAGEGEEGGIALVDGGAVTLTARFGYRTVGDGSADHNDEFPNDVSVETKPAASSQESAAEGDVTPDEAAALGAADNKDEGSKGDQDNISVEEPTEEETSGVAVHNLSREYVAHCLSSSPLVELKRNAAGKSQQSPPIDLVFMAHNPEAQGSNIASKGAPIEEVRGLVKERLTDAFVGLETGVAENAITSYGVCSNGLSLPRAHPLHLPWEDVLEAASNAVGLVHGDDSITGILPGGRVSGLSTLQLPANLLETSGLKVASDVKAYLASDDGDEGDEMPPKFPNLPPDVDTYITRPLTCYPDRGTGSGLPFKLVDYLIDTTTTPDLTSPSTKVWTNSIVDGNRPPHYGQALSATMGHFDATSILEAGQERKLTVEERETLDGCRLLQSMIHDLDANLDSVRSFAAYEEELYQKVVPLIHDTFEELDEDSAAVLQAFFVAHGAAVRHAIAKTTRTLLKEGGDGVPPYDIPDDVTLQEFALQFLLRDANVNKVIVGCPQPEHVLEAMHAADHLNKQSS